MPRAVAENMPDRLVKAAAEVRDTGEAHRLALRHRRELIFEAVDTEGMHQREVAKLVGMSQARVSAILATPGGDDDE
jgi:predicted XRE-type DNA-binding protein